MDIKLKTMKPLKPASTLLSAALLTLLSACAATTEQPAETAAETAAAAQPLNDFPTQDRVEYVLECVAKKGGLKYETLYPCICKIDKIAEKMKYNEYAEARTINFMRKTPGEQGGIFRDPPKAKQLRDQLKSAEKYAEDSCVVKQPF
jgi:hypothetical protein